MMKLSQIKEIQELRDQGYSQRKVAAMLNLNRRTVNKYWQVDSSQVCLRKPTRNRSKKLTPVAQVVKDLYVRHRNCDVVRQELEKKNLAPPALRTIQAFVKPLKRELEIEEKKTAKARKRIETVPGEYMQIDFGVVTVKINDQPTKVHLFVATLAYSRRIFTVGSLKEKQRDWFLGIEQAFRYFEGVPKFIVCDNAKTLVDEPATQGKRECSLNDRFHGFCRHWNVCAVACYPYYPQSKGKVERMVGYVKRNAIAGHEFDSIESLNFHLQWWMKAVSDLRVMDLPEDQEPVPINRFEEERKYLQSLRGRSYYSLREEYRTVSAKGLLTVDGQQYQLPPTYAKFHVRILITDKELQVFHHQKLLTTLEKANGAVKHINIDRVCGSQMPKFGSTDRREWRFVNQEAEAAYFNNPLQAPLSAYDEITGYRTMEAGHA